MKNLFLALSILLTTQIGIAQNFVGVIDYQITYENLPEEAKGMESMLPKEVKFFGSGQQARMEMDNAMMGKQVTLIDNKKRTAVQLVDLMGQKIAVMANFDDEAEAAKPKITYLDETKTIAGYLCKKAIIEDPEGEGKMEVFYTEKIQNFQSDQFQGIKGMPLEYEVEAMGFKMKFSAQKVEAKKLEASLFEIPEGYTKMDADQMG
ncbi:MAG: DUF4412 domain-containing protein, partial [Luteibaculaceae bacterium]